MTTGIEPNRHAGSRALVLGPQLALDWPGSFNALVQDVSQRANTWTGSSAARKVLTEKDGLTAQAIYRETDTGRDYEWGGPGIGWRRFQGGQKLFTWRRDRSADFDGITPVDASPSFTFVVGGTIPTASAKAGEWEITTAGRWRSDADSTIGFAQIMFGTQNVAGDMQYDLRAMPSAAESLGSIGRVTLAADATAPVSVALRVLSVSKRVRLYDVGIAISARYVGPLT